MRRRVRACLDHEVGTHVGNLDQGAAVDGDRGGRTQLETVVETGPRADDHQLTGEAAASN